MSEQEESMQRFESFVFEGDDRWQRFLDAVELPASSGVEGEAASAAALRRLKAKWYKATIVRAWNVYRHACRTAGIALATQREELYRAFPCAESNLEAG
jgi:hypothetical protein